MTTKWIHILFLENQKWLLHVSNTISETDLFIECTLMYDFVQLNKPIYLVESIEYKDTLDINYKVKQYMKKYGFENVRGGTYSENYLPSYYCKTLEDELSEKSFQELQETIMFIQKMRAKYHNTMESLEKEKEHLLKKLEKFHQTQTRYHLIVSSLFMTEEKNPIIMRREINKNFEWVETFLRRIELREPFLETKNEISSKYKQFFFFCKHLLTSYSSFLETEDIEEPTLPVYISHPEFALDLFFYHFKSQDISKYKIQFQEAMECFQKMEYMKNILFNRMEEYEFDLSSASPLFETKIRVSIDYIDSLTSTI